VDASEFADGEAMADEQLLHAPLRVHAVVGKLTVVVEPEQAGDLLRVRVAIREVRDVEHAAGAQYASYFFETSVTVLDMLENAARENGVEASILEGQSHRVGTQVSLDFGKALERQRRRGLQISSIVESDRVDALLPEQRGDLSPPAAPVEQPAGPAARQVACKRPILEHLRARAKIGVEGSHRGILGK
jgi:hypothetical protein